jgi:zinc protease
MKPIRTLLALAALLSTSVFAATHIAEHVTRERIAGIDVIVYPTSVKDVVTVVGALPAGDAMVGEGNITLPTLTGMMLDRGTISEDQFAIARKLEAVGASIRFGTAPQVLNIQARVLKKELPLVVGLIAEQLRTPAFKAEEFEKARQHFEGWIDQSTMGTEYRAAESYARAAYPSGHLNRMYSVDEYRTALKSVTLEEVKAYHRAHYGPAHMILVLVGDVDTAALRTEIERAFAGWTGSGEAMPSAAPATLSGAHTDVVRLAGKTSVSVLLGAPTGLQYRDPDALALRVGTAILGSGFTGRLMTQVRDREGLTFHIGAGLADDTFSDGSWQVEASFAPQLLEKGIAATRREVEAWWAGGVTAQELAMRKQGLIGNYHVSLATTGGMAGALLQAVERGHEISWLDEYPEAINALTLSQVNAAIKKHVDPTKLVLVEAGTVP